jgi:hypothetical protein
MQDSKHCTGIFFDATLFLFDCDIKLRHFWQTDMGVLTVFSV